MTTKQEAPFDELFPRINCLPLAVAYSRFREQLPTMTLASDVNFCFQLRPNGWSTAQLFVDRELIEFRLTHVFGDPIESLLKAALQLATGEEAALIEWRDEPGAYFLRFQRVPAQQYLLLVEASEHSTMLPCCNDSNLVRSSSFYVARDFWLLLVYLEMNKISELLRYKQYSSTRKYAFPRPLFEGLKTAFRNSQILK